MKRKFTSKELERGLVGCLLDVLWLFLISAFIAIAASFWFVLMYAIFRILYKKFTGQELPHIIL